MTCARPLGVVVRGELIEQCLELGEAGRLGLLGGGPFLEGLLGSLGLALGLGVVRLAVLLSYAKAAQLVLEGVAAALAAGQSGGEDHAIEFLSAVKQFGGVWS